MGVVHGGTESTRSCCVIIVLISVEAISLFILNSGIYLLALPHIYILPVQIIPTKKSSNPTVKVVSHINFKFTQP